MEERHHSAFISYRRSTSRHLARLVFNDLRSNEFDPFLDVKSLGSGEFGTVILNEISARAHFVFLVSQGSLQRCQEPADWLRREFEQAVRTKRNIIPVFDDGVSIESIRPLMTGPLERLTQYNAISFYYEYLDAGLERLRNWLSVPIVVVIEKRDVTQQAAVDEKIDAAIEQGLPTDRELAAEKAYNAAWRTVDMDERIRLFSEAIEDDPSNASAYFERANTYRDKSQLKKALTDYDRAVAASPAEPNYIFKRGLALSEAGRPSEALKDFKTATDLYTVDINNDPHDLNLYLARASARKQIGDMDGTMRDLNHVINLPEDQLRTLWEDEVGEEYKNFPVVNALWYRALLRFRKKEYEDAISDCNRIIKEAKHKEFGEAMLPLAYWLRGTAHGELGHRMSASRDIHKGSRGGDTDGKSGLIFFSYMLAYPLLGKYLDQDVDDPLKELTTMFNKMADELTIGIR